MGISAMKELNNNLYWMIPYIYRKIDRQTDRKIDGWRDIQVRVVFTLCQFHWFQSQRLTQLTPLFPLYRKQSINLQCKPNSWFVNDQSIGLQWVNHCLLLKIYGILCGHYTLYAVTCWIYMMRCTIWYHLYNLKNVKNISGGVLLLVKL